MKKLNLRLIVSLGMLLSLVLTATSEPVVQQPLTKGGLIEKIRKLVIHYPGNFAHGEITNIDRLDAFLENLCDQLCNSPGLPTRPLKPTPQPTQPIPGPVPSPTPPSEEDEVETNLDCDIAATQIQPTLSDLSDLSALNAEEEVLSALVENSECAATILGSTARTQRILNNQVILVLSSPRQHAGLILRSLLDGNRKRVQYFYPTNLNLIEKGALENELKALRDKLNIIQKILKNAREDLYDKLVLEFEKSIPVIKAAEDDYIVLRAEIVFNVLDALTKTRRFQEAVDCLEVITVRIDCALRLGGYIPRGGDINKDLTLGILNLAVQINSMHRQLLQTHPQDFKDRTKDSIDSPEEFVRLFHQLRDQMILLLGDIRLFYILDPLCPVCE